MDSWLRKYIYLMFCIGNTEVTLAEAAILKYTHIPKRLYKYRTFCQNHVTALERGVLYFTATSHLNDIKEANIVLSDQAKIDYFQTIFNDIQGEYDLPEAKVTNLKEMLDFLNSYFKEHSNKKDLDFSKSEEYKELEKELEEQQAEKMNNILQANRNMYSVCSFSAANDINNMWALYAQDHQGYCIEYDFKSLGEDSLFTALLFPVIYAEDNRLIVNDINRLNGNTGLLAATLKNKNEWGYEQEWRLVHDVKEHGTPQPMPKPTGIYLGVRTCEKDETIMKDYCYKNTIPMYKMIYNQNTDRIEPKLIVL